MNTRFFVAMLVGFFSVGSFAATPTPAETYQSGIDFTKIPDGGQSGGQNASNITNLIKLFVMHQSLEQATDASVNPNFNNANQTQDINTLRKFFQESNDKNKTPSMDLSGPGGRGDQKKLFCLDYVDKIKTPNPDPTKYAECQAVNELNGTRIKDYRATTGFSHADAIFGSGTQAGQARQLITDTPQSQLLSVVGVGGASGTSGQQCVTVNKTSPPVTSTGQCSRGAVPDSMSCGKTITPKVILEKYCNAHGGPTPVTSYISGTDNTTFGLWGVVTTSTSYEPYFLSTSVGPVQIEYACGQKSALDQSVTTIIARIFVSPGTFPTAAGPIEMEFTPGNSHPIKTGALGTYSWKSCVTGNMGCNWNGEAWIYGEAYDGLTDTVNVSYLGKSSDGGVAVGGGTMASCAAGTNFIPESLPFTYSTCTTDFSGNQTCVNHKSYIVPSRCETPGFSSLVSFVSTVTSYPAKPVWTMDGTIYTCPSGGIVGHSWFSFGYVNPSPAATTCYVAHYPSCPPPPSGDTWITSFGVTTFAPVNGNAGGEPVYGPQYCTLQSSIDNLHLYAPAPHYLGGAGVRERLIETVVDTCAPLQAQSATGPTATGGSYPPITKTDDTCPTNWKLQVASATFPAICQFQPDDIPALATVSFICPQGGIYNTASLLCEYQKQSYASFASELYTCPVGDTVQGGACPNSGLLSGNTCLYKAYNATIATQTCPNGYYPSGTLCYNDPNLIATITAPNGTSVLESTKTYSCTGTDKINGAMCEPSAQVVVCSHQPPGIPATGLNHYSCPTGNKTGSYFINYSIADNKIWSQSCLAFMTTKPATLQKRVCDAPYSYNAATDKCEYQMADYNSTSYPYCSDTSYSYISTSGQRWLRLVGQNFPFLKWKPCG